jgi:hypothetical protein
MSSTQICQRSVASQLCALVSSFVLIGLMICPTCDTYGNPLLCNPVQWWYSQRIAGNAMEGLTHMALDVLMTPGELFGHVHRFHLLTLDDVLTSYQC